jgi:predicted nucleotidyltransferase
MHTTIALQPATHERLLRLKLERKLPSMDALVRQLLDAPVPSAMSLFKQHEAEVRAVCKKYGVTRLVAYGSRARGDAKPSSDLDLVADVPPGVGLFEVANLMGDLEGVFGMRVDLATNGPHLGRLLASIARDGVVLIG